MFVRYRLSIESDRFKALESVKEEDPLSSPGIENNRALRFGEAAMSGATKSRKPQKQSLGTKAHDYHVQSAENEKIVKTAEKVQEKFILFLDASNAALKKLPVSKRYPAPLKDTQQHALVSNSLSPRTSCKPFSSKCLIGCQREAEIPHKTSPSLSKRAMSEGNMMQDFAWQRLFGTTYPLPDGATTASTFGSFLAARRSTPASLNATKQEPERVQDGTSLDELLKARASGKRQPSKFDKAQENRHQAWGQSKSRESTADASAILAREATKVVCYSELSVYQLQVARSLRSSQAVWL
jgi:hypothetical protein